MLERVILMVRWVLLKDEDPRACILWLELLYTKQIAFRFCAPANSAANHKHYG